MKIWEYVLDRLDLRERFALNHSMLAAIGGTNY